MNSQATRNEKASSANTTRFMPAIADRVEAGGRASEIDDDEKERRERIKAEICADTREPECKTEHLRPRPHQQVPQRRNESGQRCQQTGAVDQIGAPGQ